MKTRHVPGGNSSKIQLPHKSLANPNKVRVIQAVRKYGPVSVARIVQFTGLSKPTVDQYVEVLRKDGFIYAEGLGESNGGRRPTLYAFCNSAFYTISIELEIPRCRVGVVDLEGNVLSHSEYMISSSKSIQQALLDIAEQIYEIMTQLGIPGNRYLGIGIGVSGYLSKGQGVALFSPRLADWRDVPLRSYFEQRFGLPVYLDSWINLALLGQINADFQPLGENLAYVDVSRGVGAGLLLGGKSYTGPFGNAGVIGHMVMEPGGRQCHCGKRGCLEQYCSEPALVRRFRELNSPENGDTDISADIIFSKYEAGDEIAHRVVEEGFKYLATGVANLITLFEIQTVIMGGVLASIPPNLAQLLSNLICDNTPPILRRSLVINYASHRDVDAVLKGAMHLTVASLFDISQGMAVLKHKGDNGGMPIYK
ncbi:MAG: ROK family transcriptional regulator [Firmicutes bacterium]|nr:ROK family transcriptional regulator [Bacillota bacterium]